MNKIIVSAWKNGQSSKEASMYGIYVPSKYLSNFRRSWRIIELSIEGGDFFKIEITPSFWKNCHELRHENIGKWFKANNYEKWEKNNPPRFNLTKIDHIKFRLDKR